MSDLKTTPCRACRYASWHDNTSFRGSFGLYGDCKHPEALAAIERARELPMVVRSAWPDSIKEYSYDTMHCYQFAPIGNGVAA